MKNNELREQLNIRYTEALYLGFNKGNFYHFIYAYKRIFIEILKSILVCFKSFKQPSITNVLAIYSTNNQKKALLNAKMAGIYDGELIHIDKLSFKSSLLRLLTWSLKFLCYPIAFVFSNKKAGLYYTLFTPLMRICCELKVKNIIKFEQGKVFLSNDHTGDIFIISILLRDINHIRVAYVQHGAVKAKFPDNYFDEIYVYNERYLSIYQTLAKNKHCQIVIDKRIDKPVIDSSKLTRLNGLICLSHQFPIYNVFKGISLLYQNGYLTIAVRFHPSDKLANIKFNTLKFFFRKLKLSSSMISYIDDFNRAEKVFCASSSLLVDAFENGFTDNLIWVKPFGLTWDYYDLEDKIKTLHSLDHICEKH